MVRDVDARVRRGENGEDLSKVVAPLLSHAIAKSWKTTYSENIKSSLLCDKRMEISNMYIKIDVKF